jgi:hypothetical protein
MSYGFAGADGRGNEVRRREYDRAFLAWLRTATLSQLELFALGRSALPRWRNVALDRAITRLRLGDSGPPVRKDAPDEGATVSPLLSLSRRAVPPHEYFHPNYTKGR